MITTVKCPTCEQPVIWSDESKFKPFCCERCKLIDLGEWATEQYTIAGEKQQLADEQEEY